MANAQPVDLNQPTPHENIGDAVTRLRRTYNEGRTKPAAYRVDQLQRLAKMIKDRETQIIEALAADFGKCAFEAWFTETGYTLSEIEHALKHLGEWMKPERVTTPLINQPGYSTVIREPLGTVLVIAPWNYPFQLAICPLIGAIAAGNTAVIKPSELTPHTSKIIFECIRDYLDPDAYTVIEGGIPQSTELLEQRFDHIFFTGGTSVGKIVMGAAAKHLTPVTLELGGKSPAIIDDKVDLDTAVKRIAWGKFVNAGQTCLAPDYILVHQKHHDAFIEKMRAAITEFYGVDPRQSSDFPRIVNGRHHERLTKYLSGGTAAIGGESDLDERYLAPTVLTDVDLESPVMQDEIFGPILPVIAVAGLNEAISFVNERPRPLALYLFSKSRSARDQVLANTSSGDACINDVIAHYGVPDIPFGGVGQSGMGAYHGKWSFETFSHRKGVLTKSSWPDPPLRYPPYNDSKLAWLKRLM